MPHNVKPLGTVIGVKMILEDPTEPVNIEELIEILKYDIAIAKSDLIKIAEFLVKIKIECREALAQWETGGATRRKSKWQVPEVTETGQLTPFLGELELLYKI